MAQMKPPVYDIISFFPKNFFSKTVNEPFIQKIMARVLDVKEWKPGNPNRFEPDYFGDGIPFEFTIASDSKKKNNFVQRMMSGQYTSENVESDVFRYIQEAIEKKAQKHYSVENVHLCVLCLLEMFNWVAGDYGSYMHFLLDYPRTEFFNGIRRDYIDTHKFNNIFIIFPDMCGKWWVYDALTEEKVKIHLLLEDYKSGEFPYVIEKGIYEKYIK